MDDRSICFTGNCQSTVIAWAIKLMNPDVKIFWISVNKNWDEGWDFRYIPESFLLRKDEGKDYLANCDVLIHQDIYPNANTKSWMNNTKEKCERVSISSIHFDVANPCTKGMREREEKKNIDIRLSKVFDNFNLELLDKEQGINKCTKQHRGKHLQHHDSSFYKEIIEIVCNRIKLNFDSRLFIWLTEAGFPFNKKGWNEK